MRRVDTKMRSEVGGRRRIWRLVRVGVLVGLFCAVPVALAEVLR